MKLALYLFLVVTVLLPLSAFSQNLEIHYINVGWGGSTLVVGPDGTTILLEAGDTGEGTASVVPYLASIGIDSTDGLDYTIVGHQHCDHLGGLDEVVNAGYDVHTKNYYNGSSTTSSCVTGWNSAAATTTAGSPITMTVGTVINLGYGAKLTCVAQNGNIIGGGTISVSDENDRSLAILVQYGGFDYLWASDMGGGQIDQSCTGRTTSQKDIETSVITAISPGGASPMITTQGIDVLHCNHHGSESSTNKNWMNLSKPSLAVISVGHGQSASYQLPRIHAVDSVLLAGGSACITVPATLVLQTEEGDPTGAATSFSGYCVGNITISTNGVTNYTVSADGAVTVGSDERAAAGLPQTITLDDTSGTKIVDSFSDGNFSSNPAWGGTTTTFQVVTSSDVGAGATNSYSLRLNQTTAVSGTEYLSTQRTASWGSSQSWSWWWGRRGQAATDANNASVWVFANESNLTSGTVDGYRVKFGDDSGNDEIVLQSVTNGTATTILTSSGSVPNGQTDYGFMVRVTRTSGSVWTLYTSTLPTSNGTGAIATDLPIASNITVNQGSITDSTYNSFSNGYVGFVAVHSSGSTPRVGCEFDQLSFDTSSTASLIKSGVSFTTVPSLFNLYQNYPNPFNPTTTIRYDLPVTANVRISIYDVLGKEVALLIDTQQPAGEHFVEFNTPGLSSGVYFYRLEANDITDPSQSYNAIRKLAVIK